MLAGNGIISILGTVLLVQKCSHPSHILMKIVAAQLSTVGKWVCKFRTMTFACVYRSVGEDNGKNRLECSFWNGGSERGEVVITPGFKALSSLLFCCWAVLWLRSYSANCKAIPWSLALSCMFRACMKEVCFRKVSNTAWLFSGI